MERLGRIQCGSEKQARFFLCIENQQASTSCARLLHRVDSCTCLLKCHWHQQSQQGQSFQFARHPGENFVLQTCCLAATSIYTYIYIRSYIFITIVYIYILYIYISILQPFLLALRSRCCLDQRLLILPLVLFSTSGPLAILPSLAFTTRSLRRATRPMDMSGH